jgi:hypothetical protein
MTNVSDVLDHLLGDWQGDAYVIAEGAIKMSEEEGDFWSLEDSIVVAVILTKYFCDELLQFLI